MSDDLPDIRVISVTLEGPSWEPKVEWGQDFDDFSVPTILRVAAAMLEEDLVSAFLIDPDDDDDEEAE